ncbi:TetR/AcrR family transcriptional regulator [Dermacoccus nishinomiyaensis]|uniref:TetR/AcrR family transcriptional regulator n=1 Tax=Dermacoccus nishinomiyaensis TaxID=1274 RepID=UPI0013F44B20|nr:TetR/AcrR family transcriptional regulator [Dermacoccus nishinomiyaensis]NHC31228.1 TetR/AcrR family transcriptional regulator [Dermacoccus nishinomiyaensis]
MRQSSREVILDAALALMRRQEPVSLDTVAHAAGLTKPGLMYHFKTKEALMLAVVDRVADDQKRQLEKLLADVDPASPWPRMTAYVRWMMSGQVDEADLAMMADPRLRDVLTRRWEKHFEPWVALPEGLDPQTRARLEGARFMADGVWFADASGALPLDDAGRSGVQALAEQLLAPQARHEQHEQPGASGQQEQADGTSGVDDAAEVRACDDDAPHHAAPSHEPDTKPGKKIKNVKEEKA